MVSKLRTTGRVQERCEGGINVNADLAAFRNTHTHKLVRSLSKVPRDLRNRGNFHILSRISRRLKIVLIILFENTIVKSNTWYAC